MGSKQMQQLGKTYFFNDISCFSVFNAQLHKHKQKKDLKDEKDVNKLWREL